MVASAHNTNSNLDVQRHVSGLETTIPPPLTHIGAVSSRVGSHKSYTTLSTACGRVRLFKRVLQATLSRNQAISVSAA